MPSPPTVEPATRGFVLALVALAAAAAVVSVLSLELVHPALSWNRDEPVYLWHVEVLDAGRLTSEVGTPPEAFRPWLAGVGQGEYFSQYTIGWPVALLLAKWIVGTPAGAVVLGSVLHAIGAVLATRTVLGRNRLALAAGAVAVVSPAAVIQAGVHLSYLFTAGLGTLSLAAAWPALGPDPVRGARVRLVAAGLALSVVLLTRPYDAVIWGLILVIGVVLRDRDRALGVRLRSLVGLWPLVLVGIPAVVATIVYNLRITGEALTFPIVATDPLDTFGFGKRRLMPAFDPVDYDLGEAAYSSVKNAGFFVLFLSGNLVTAGLAVAGAWWRRERPSTWVLLTMAVAFPLGYFAFWGMHISSLTARIVGAIYYVPAIVPVAALALVGLAELHRRRRVVAIVVGVCAVLISVPVLVDRLSLNRDISANQAVWGDSVEGLEGPALVFVAESGPYAMFKNPQGRNGPLLDDDVLYALDLGPRNLDTIAAHPGRTPYLQVASAAAEELGPREEPFEYEVELVPVSVARGTRLVAEATFLPLDGAPVVVPFIDIGGNVRWGDPGDAEPVGDGSFRSRWSVDPAITGSLPEGAIVRLGFGAGSSVSEAQTDPRIRWEIPVEVDDGQVVAMLPAQQFQRFAVGPDRKWYPRRPYQGVGFTARVES